MVDGQVRPLQVETHERGRKVKRWVMVYQAPGEQPLPLCSPRHVSSLMARHDPEAKRWAKRIELEGHQALEDLRTVVALKLQQEKIEEDARP